MKAKFRHSTKRPTHNTIKYKFYEKIRDFEYLKNKFIQLNKVYSGIKNQLRYKYLNRHTGLLMFVTLKNMKTGVTTFFSKPYPDMNPTYAGVRDWVLGWLESILRMYEIKKKKEHIMLRTIELIWIRKPKTELDEYRKKIKKLIK